MQTYFDTLELRANASIQDIKASYRRLAKEFHPDAGAGHGDAVKFQRVHEAYHHLMKRTSRNQENGPVVKKSISPKLNDGSGRGKSWRFEGVAEDGMNAVYVIRTSREAALDGLTALMPWKAEDACPSCLGLGHSLKPIFGGPHMKRSVCLKCQGKGVVKHNSTVHVELSPENIRDGKKVMKGLGRYSPVHSKRGDLVIQIKTDETPRRRFGFYAS